jgi:energy-coupling factor transporter ATP-binding protein EcfA2
MSGRVPGQVIFLTGPPGSGKTTTAMAWALSRSHPTWNLEWDSVRASLAVARQLGRGCLPDELNAQYRLAASVMAGQAAEITAGGNDCIVVGAWVLRPPAGWETWAAIEQSDPIVAVLLPDVETAVARNVSDQHRQGAFEVPEEHVRGSYALGWQEWRNDPRAVVIDNTSLTRTETVDALEAAISTHTKAPPRTARLDR